MRMYGRLTLHAESVVLPLLAPDAPVVTWWNTTPPDQIAYDPLGVLADRRVTDAAAAPDPLGTLRQRAEDYAPGRHRPRVGPPHLVAWPAGQRDGRRGEQARSRGRLGFGRQPERRVAHRLARGPAGHPDRMGRGRRTRYAGPDRADARAGTSWA